MVVEEVPSQDLIDSKVIKNDTVSFNPNDESMQAKNFRLSEIKTDKSQVTIPASLKPAEASFDVNVN